VNFADFIPGRMPGVMGILNVTPDSFSGDGRLAEAAILYGRALIASGANMLDVGGESTRPGMSPVAVEDEIARVVPVIEALSPLIPISIDTRNAATMAAALDAGATVVNDVTALRHDAEALALVARRNCPVIIMHMPGTDPRTMQAQTGYADVVAEVTGFLLERAAALRAAGISQICLDPGIGFGKTLTQNLALLRALPALVGQGYPVLLGASRKSFIAGVTPVPVEARLPGSLAAALTGAGAGVAWLRVHDVAETRQALAVWAAIHDAGETA
jgi:dihydropteroate synthase